MGLRAQTALLFTFIKSVLLRAVPLIRVVFRSIRIWGLLSKTTPFSNHIYAFGVFLTVGYNV